MHDYVYIIKNTKFQKKFPLIIYNIHKNRPLKFYKNIQCELRGIKIVDRWIDKVCYSPKVNCILDIFEFLVL